MTGDSDLDAMVRLALIEHARDLIDALHAAEQAGAGLDDIAIDELHEAVVFYADRAGVTL